MEKAKPHTTHRNKHHILYPERAWLRLGLEGRVLRSGFVVKINRDVHKQLHDEIDPKLGGYVYMDKLPSKKTLKYLCREFEKNERVIKKMKPIEKIEWLESRLSYGDAHSYWLKTMLRRQREFLENHTGEL